MKKSLNLLIILALILGSAHSVWAGRGGPKSERHKKLWAERNREFSDFGTIQEIHYKAQKIQVEKYNWDTHEMDVVEYRYNVRFIKKYNFDKMRELKKGSDIEFFWKKKGHGTKLITKISLGTMPIEEADLNMDWLEDEEEKAAAAKAAEEDEYSMDWVDYSIPEEELNMDWVDDPIEDPTANTKTENIPAAVP